MVKIGDKIRIIHLIDEPYNSNYEGKEGVVETIKTETDPWGYKKMSGTWGGIFIYIDKDSYEIIEEMQELANANGYMRPAHFIKR
jgi:hydrogenase maturation factor HypF (carbamoyltransferase family)